MNFVDHLNMYGVEAMQLPCIKGGGAPTEATEGAVGLLYMDTNNGAMYKCIAVEDSAYTWVEVAAGEGPTIKQVLSDNLFDKATATKGACFYYSSSGIQLVNADWSYYQYVPLRGAGTYRTKWNNGQHSSTTNRVGIVKEDNSWFRTINGILTATDDNEAYDMEFVITQEMIDGGAAKVAFDCDPTELDTVMMVKDREYPSVYIPYGYIEVEVGGAKATNILSGKTAVFLGDSICAGTTTLSTDKEYGWGWGGIIGNANNMSWKNYGRNGGTVVPIDTVDQERWVPYQVDLAAAQYPNADYVIFEGGTNDADVLKDSGIGSFSESGYAPTDDSNFTGAFEMLVLKILNAYPHAKVGYIVAPKMGVSNDYGSTNTRRKFFDRAVEVCKKWGIPVLDLWNNNPMNPKLSVYYDSSLTADEANANGKCYTDGQHLTLAGYNRVTPQIEAFMRNL